MKQRDPAAMLESPRCGTSCRAPAVHGKRRCRMHGGALGSGAPLGNHNAFKHGLYTKEERARFKQFRALNRQVREFLRK